MQPHPRPIGRAARAARARPTGAVRPAVEKWAPARLLLSCLAAVWFGIAGICEAEPSEEVADPRAPAARVGDAEISQGAVQELVKSVLLARSTPPDSAEIGRLSDSALASLIDLELLHQEALRRHIAVSDAEVDTEIERVQGHFSDADEFSAALRRSNLSRQQLQTDTRKTLLVNKLLRNVVWADIEIPEEQVRAFYDENREALSQPPSVHLREIVLDIGAAAKADELRSQLVGGADFAELAFNYSIDRTSAARGGDRGFLERGDLPAPVAEAAFRLPIGENSEVIRTADGFHIIQVVERNPGRLPPLDGVRDSISAVLAADEREERRRRFLADLREKTEIEVFPPFALLPEPSDTPTPPVAAADGGEATPSGED